MPWKKGQSGNPHGAPKKQLRLCEIVHRVGNEPDAVTKAKNKLEMVRAMFRQAKFGNVQAARWLSEVGDSGSLNGGLPGEISGTFRFTWQGENGEDHNGPI